MKRLLQYNILIFIGILVTTIAKADEWFMPQVSAYYSENNEYKLIVTPTFFPENYFRYLYKSDKRPKSKRILRKIEELEQGITPCVAELYKESETGSVLIWKKPLLNDICPIHAIVANDGSSVATFDNWYSMGYGKNIFVVYDEKGEAKRSYKLEEISPFPLDDYMKSVVSLWWNNSGSFKSDSWIWNNLETFRNRGTFPSYLANDCIFIDNERIEIIFDSKENIQRRRIYNVKSLEFEE